MSLTKVTTSALARSSVALSLLGIAMCALPAHALTLPAMRISDAAGNVITIDASGTATPSGSCTASTCVTTNTNGTGIVNWLGTIGNFSFGLTGTYQLAAGVVPVMDVNVSNLSTSGSGGTLTILYTQTGISGAPAYTLTAITTSGSVGGTVTYSAYTDPGNTAFNAAVPVGTITAPAGDSVESQSFSTGSSSSAMSVTEVQTLTVAGSDSGFSSDFYTEVSPNVISNCVVINAIYDVAITPVTLTASGGLGPYTFTASGLPAGLSISSGGQISGTPTVTGTFPYTVTITDTGTGNTSTSSCSITVTVPSTPGITLSKTANPTSAVPFQLVTYTYEVTNTGGTTLNNIVVTDDNGCGATSGIVCSANTPPVTIGTIASLAPGASATLTWATYPTLNTVIVDSSAGTMPGGALFITPVPALCMTPGSATYGTTPCNLSVTINQSLSLNDNTFGTNSSSGWGSKTHQASDLYGSDQGWFAFYDKAGTLDLEVNLDYSSAASAPPSACPNTKFTSYPSGYGTLGDCGGDGSFVYPSSSQSPYVVSFDTTLTDDQNMTSDHGTLYTENSPTPGTTDYTNWNLIDGYSVVINPAVFNAGGGFGVVTIPLIHNSPSKNGTDQVAQTPASSVLTNTATAVVTVSGATLSATATASVTITSPYTPVTAGGGGPGGGKAPPTPPAPALKVQFPAGPDANGTVGTAYNSTFTATGGTAPYTYSITSGSLPDGLSLNPSTGTIIGTPTTATSGPANKLTVTVTDSSKPAVTATANGNINIVAAPAPPTKPTPPPPPLKVQFPGGKGANGTVGTAYSASFTATGGTAPYTFSITTGSLPAGLTLNASTGAIAGTPTTVTSGPAAQLTVTVTDSSTPQLLSTANGNINIAAAGPTPPAPPTPPTPPTPPAPPAPPAGVSLTLTIPGGPAANGTVGTAYSLTLGVTGGTAPYTFSVSAGTLPAGLSLNSLTGAITGKPTAAVSGPAAQLTIKVVDHAGNSTTAPCTINVVTAPPAPPAGPPAPPKP